MPETVTLSWKDYQELKEKAEQLDRKKAQIETDMVMDRVSEATKELYAWNAELRQAVELWKGRCEELEASQN